MKSGTGSSGKLEALMKRQAAVTAALRAEKEKRKAIERRDYERLTGIVGRSALVNAAQSGEFRQFLVGVLRTTVTDESDQKFLKAKEFL